MDFFEMIQRLQLIYDQQIILISCGAFYIAIGADAVILNHELNLKTICAKRRICKVGIPKNSIEKYIEKLEQTGYGYIILDYEKDKNEIIKKYEKLPIKHKKIFDFNKGCMACPNTRDKYIIY